MIKQYLQMFSAMFKKNSITKIAKVMPLALVETFEKKSFYSTDEVRSLFEKEFKYQHNIEYAFAMFCDRANFEKLALESTYANLRLDISEKCFDDWPRFNFDSLLNYSQRSTPGVGGGDGCGGGE